MKWSVLIILLGCYLIAGDLVIEDGFGDSLTVWRNPFYGVNNVSIVLTTSISTSTTTTMKSSFNPSVYSASHSKVRNVSRSQYEPNREEYCDPLFCGLLGFPFRVF
jgi:hypothetical protein